jgi:PIN domain nuclease of toxin-antitoxin system
MDHAANSGEILVVDEVAQELGKKDDGAFKWIKERGVMVIPIDAEIQSHVVYIMSAYSRLVDTKKNRSVGDPWVIALARARRLTVVTAEKATGKLAKPKIPDVCKDLGIACIEVVDFFRQQGWRV